jgi:hypothetical protein
VELKLDLKNLDHFHSTTSNGSKPSSLGKSRNETAFCRQSAKLGASITTFQSAEEEGALIRKRADLEAESTILKRKNALLRLRQRWSHG